MLSTKATAVNAQNWIAAVDRDMTTWSEVSRYRWLAVSAAAAHDVTQHGGSRIAEFAKLNETLIPPLANF